MRIKGSSLQISNSNNSPPSKSISAFKFRTFISGDGFEVSDRQYKVKMTKQSRKLTRDLDHGRCRIKNFPRDLVQKLEQVHAPPRPPSLVPRPSPLTRSHSSRSLSRVRGALLEPTGPPVGRTPSQPWILIHLLKSKSESLEIVSI